ncbi:lipocalin-like domain-containing protein [Segatella oulorum]|uniref:lipocalin-like domain-containing protein n=1 Tax=Segatella oulorum TaxID=28136 RepID=UPI0023F50C7F|nr:lipocalin-like domain-containing protein [Segatella oulorum]
MKYLSIFFAFMFCLSACELETSHNGKLDGWWLLTAVDTLQTGGHANVEAQQCTWAFQGRLLELRDVPGQRGDYLLSFAQHGDDLLLSHPYLSARDSGDIAVQTPQPLHPYGIQTLSEQFSITTIDRRHMVLTSTSLRLYFRKL